MANNLPQNFSLPDIAQLSTFNNEALGPDAWDGSLQTLGTEANAQHEDLINPPPSYEQVMKNDLYRNGSSGYESSINWLTGCDSPGKFSTVFLQ